MCYRLQTRTVEWLSARHQTDLVTFLDSESHFTTVQKEWATPPHVQVRHATWHQFYQAFPRVSTASDKRWGEKAWVRGYTLGLSPTGFVKGFNGTTLLCCPSVVRWSIDTGKCQSIHWKYNSDCCSSSPRFWMDSPLLTRCGIGVMFSPPKESILEAFQNGLMHTQVNSLPMPPPPSFIWWEGLIKVLTFHSSF